MVEAQQVDTAHIQLGTVYNLGLLEQRLGQVVVNLKVAQLQERAVGQPEG